MMTIQTKNVIPLGDKLGDKLGDTQKRRPYLSHRPHQRRPLESLGLAASPRSKFMVQILTQNQERLPAGRQQTPNAPQPQRTLNLERGEAATNAPQAQQTLNLEP